MRFHLRVHVALLALLAFPAVLSAQTVQERVDLDAIERIREEGLDRSRIAGIVGHLTDVIGPRLTGSPAMHRANDWTADRLREWGLTGVAVEPWGEFGRGWENIFYHGRILTPHVQTLHGAPVAWTGSTAGRVEGPVVLVEADSPEELRERYQGTLGGTFVIHGQLRPADSEEDRPPFRLPLDSLVGERAYDQEAMAEDRAAQAELRREMMAEFRERAAIRMALEEMLVSEGILGWLDASGYSYGIIEHFGRYRWDPAWQDALPYVAIAPEQYRQIWRNLGRGVPVRVELEMENRFHDDDLQAYNTFGEIQGTEWPDEYVMVGAHLDSWHGGTGATDNAAGVAVVMEAMRILRALGLEPRRTIRIALWSGEEQGTLGSRAWLERNESLHERISAYLNVDSGTGRIRGIETAGNQGAVGVFEQILWPFRDLGVVAVRSDLGPNSSDDWEFDAVGIPAFNFLQDPMDYWERSHHMSVDTYERLSLEDLEQAAVVVASTVYHLAMRDGLVPRKTEER